ncbi:peptidoglycan DD-metalloendopeptidase family protein [Metabacillus herbersteinensis]|uniref:Peptidoglycan DD-metalloendopeptidase family protein n=1 Tax=Metabacillus herbersteinensis TaxID=283816 RepID=A0ABV6GIY5_9BACI
MLKHANRLVDLCLPKRSLLKKLTIGAAFAATFTLGFTQASAEESLKTVYHVYLDNKHIGTVDNQKLIEDLSQEKVDKVEDQYKDYQLTVEDLEIIPEQMFRPVSNNEEALATLEKELDVVVVSSTLTINNKKVAFFKSKEDAEETLRQYKMKYVSEDVLNQLEAQKNSGQPLEPVKEGQSRIIDVTLSEEVSLSSEKVSPDQILSVENAVKLLEKGTLEDKKYQIKDSDVLGKIASNHNLTLDELIESNPGLKEDSLIKPGEFLNVKQQKPFIKILVKEEVSKKETVSFETDIVEEASMLKGEKKTKQEGKDGEKLLNYVIFKENGSEMKREMTKEEVLQEPVKEILVKGTKVIPSRGSGTLSWPAVGGYISSKQGNRWGKMHKGIDIARPSNRTINAADNGTIASAGYDGGYGNKVVINHNNGLKTIYAHLDSISVSPGQTVSKSQKIGVMGSTGNSTGVHLHFEVYKNGTLKNPLDYLK